MSDSPSAVYRNEPWDPVLGEVRRSCSYPEERLHDGWWVCPACEAYVLQRRFFGPRTVKTSCRTGEYLAEPTCGTELVPIACLPPHVEAAYILDGARALMGRRKPRP